MKKSGSPSKRHKKYEHKGKNAKDHEAQEQSKDPRGITPNGRFIIAAMEEHNAPGTWRDYVLFVGDSMLDAWATYNIQRMAQDGTELKSKGTVALLHKKDLHLVIGDVPAGKFWDRRLRRRTNYGAKDFHKGKTK